MKMPRTDHIGGMQHHAGGGKSSADVDDTLMMTVPLAKIGKPLVRKWKSAKLISSNVI